MNVRSIEDIAKLSSSDINSLENLLNWLDELGVLKGSPPELNKIRIAIELRKTEDLNDLVTKVRRLNKGLVGKSHDDVIRLALTHCYNEDINFDDY